jgi:hypothetical protein
LAIGYTSQASLQQNLARKMRNLIQENFCRLSLGRHEFINIPLTFQQISGGLFLTTFHNFLKKHNYFQVNYTKIIYDRPSTINFYL